VLQFLLCAFVVGLLAGIFLTWYNYREDIQELEYMEEFYAAHCLPFRVEGDE
jgi:hypothetical protein